MSTLREEIAKERFLDIMANGCSNIGEAAKQAIREADIFVDTLNSCAKAIPRQKLKGCRACYGSGGKAHTPCKVCNGSGKVWE